MIPGPQRLEAQGIAKFDLAPGPLEQSGPVNPWRFVNAVGEKAGLWGFENGRLEGWVYPLKIFHDFHLAFQMEGLPTVYRGDEIVRSVRVRPHAVELQYSAEQFTVTETLFTPRQEAGLAILLEIKAPATMRVFVRFKPDLNLMWPGSIGGQSATWIADRKWVELSEPSARFSALIGSPAAVGSTAVGYHSYLTNQQPYETIELHVRSEEAKRSYVPIVVAGGPRDIYQAPAIYDRILTNLAKLYQESLQHYIDLDERGPEFLTPDPTVNKALRWSRVSLDQLKVCNPHVGCSYVSGYGSSGTGTRPMYAWFFDEPDVTLWAYLESRGAESSREAFRFIQKFQRADGAIMHEVAQSAGLINWFKDYPYAYIHPDSPPWYLIAMGHFYRFTGDAAFLRESWASIRKAYGYCLTLLNPDDGLMRIPPGGWGSMEAADVAQEDSAMAGEWIAALRALRGMSAAMGDQALARECGDREQKATDSLEKRFWNPQLGYYNYGISPSGQPVTYLNPTVGLPAWLGSLPDDRARAVVERLSTASFLSDWGERNMSLEDPRYVEGSYQIGSVWPFMTAGPMLANFRYHHAVQGFLTWMSMNQLRFFNARGAMPEVLSGAFLRMLDNGVPHQMFSELTGIPGLIDGVLGLELDVPHRGLRFMPHLPPSWPEVAVRRFPYGNERIDLQLRQAPGQLTANLEASVSTPITLEFSPALPAGASIVSVTQDGKSVPFQTEDHGSDVHVSVSVSVTGKSELVVRYRAGVAVEVDWQPLLEGDASKNLRVLNCSYHDGRFEMTVEGRAETTYQIRLYTPWKPTHTEGCKPVSTRDNVTLVAASAPEEARAHLDKAGYARWIIRIGLD